MRLARFVPLLVGAFVVWLSPACGEDEPVTPYGNGVAAAGGTVAQVGAGGAAAGVRGTQPDASRAADASDASPEVDAFADAGDAGDTDAAPALMPQFNLVDVNPDSATYQQTLSPSYFKGQVSAWYFGHAT